MSPRNFIVAQFKQPHGLPGRLAGHIMAKRSSNRKRNQWTVGLLALEPSFRVLEIGCGPGLALEGCSAIVTKGSVVGFDHSEVMVKQAKKRLEAQIRTGRVKISLGSLDDVVEEREPYDRVFSLNVVQFFSDLNDAFRKMHGCLNQGGMAVTTYQPRSSKPTREQALEMAEKIEAAMAIAGFDQIERHELPLEPVPVISVTGVKT
jgi:cyclopropane fatty-acyl-phospholipid synthase-like methyltransferase